jgi:hypothetical protein
MRQTPLACLALCLTLPAARGRADDRTGLDLSFHYGLDLVDAVGLKSGVGGVQRAGRLKELSRHSA